MALFSFTPAEARQAGETSTSKQASQEEKTMPVKSGSTTSTQTAGTVQLPLAKVPEKPAIMRPCRVADTSFVSFQLFTETMSFDWYTDWIDNAHGMDF